jgi:hypothetical protein
MVERKKERSRELVEGEIDEVEGIEGEGWGISSSGREGGREEVRIGEKVVK